jgi:hypothetical protein
MIAETVSAYHVRITARGVATSDPKAFLRGRRHRLGEPPRGSGLAMTDTDFAAVSVHERVEVSAMRLFLQRGNEEPLSLLHVPFKSGKLGIEDMETDIRTGGTYPKKTTGRC